MALYLLSMNKYNDMGNRLLQEEIDKAIDQFYDYSYLIKEGKLQEANVSDFVKKANDMIKFAVEKTGSAASDASISIYVKLSSKLRDKIEGLITRAKDKKSGLMLRILGKVVRFFIKNPRVAFASIRIGLVILSLIGSAVGVYVHSENSDAFNDIFEKMGIDIDASNVGDADALRDQLQQLEDLEKLNDEELGHKIAQSVSGMELDVDNPEFLEKDPTGGEVAPTDLMHDPAYVDYQQAMDIVKQSKGDDTVRRLVNLAKLDRMLDEQIFKGAKFDSSTHMKTHYVSGLESNGVVQMYDNDLFVSKTKISYNGEVISSVETIHYKIERAGETFRITDTKVSGLTSDINTRVEQLTKGLDKGVVDKIFAGMKKFSDYTQSGPSWKNESTLYNKRMMYLAGIINEEGFLKKGLSTVKSFVNKVSGAAQNFLLSLKNKLNKLVTNVGSVFISDDSLVKLTDKKPHNFLIKDGKLIIQ